ncbi:ATP-binding cassette sub-family B member 10, mitochondrial isoform X7 [Ochotona princeps]|uniref:ATP-binding cassette sub-family B member 10, mitochondrial isoform X7 n=1 Tax=Ochotona princeps TaxID=9978 RepID=UPI002714E6CF|nr:ATP-binding cassette sub-family B member 10, mitochondrial isoform X7 [Ochotona princeps]
MRGSGPWPLLLLARHCPAVPGRLLPAACLWTPVTRAPRSLPLLTGLRAARPWGAGPGLVVGTGGARCLAGGPRGSGRGAAVVRLLGLWARPWDACRCGALVGPGTRRLLSAGPPGGPAAAARAGGEAWRHGSTATAEDDSRLRPAEVRRSEARKLLGLAYPERGRLAAAVGFLAVSSVITMSAPFFLGKIIDIIYTNPTVDYGDNLTRLCLGLGCVFLCGATANAIRVYLMQTSVFHLTQSGHLCFECGASNIYSCSDLWTISAETDQSQAGFTGTSHSDWALWEPDCTFRPVQRRAADGQCPHDRLSSFYSELMKGLGAGGRLWQLMEREPKLPFNEGIILNERSFQGALEFKNVHFAYPARPEALIFQDFSLSIPAGSVTALVGPSGSGKSTVVSLLLRLYDPVSGTINLDGQDIRQLNPAWLRSKIGTVSQEPILFSCSIAENIAYGADNPTSVTAAQVERVAAVANAASFIQNFPQGFDTVVGEKGVLLSGGQKQRIAIARALLKNPKILLLDEATSALDAENEHLVQEALDRLMEGRTVLIIAHRLSTIKNANMVAVLDQGKITEYGKHEELLLKTDGIYKKLIDKQRFIST